MALGNNIKGTVQGIPKAHQSHTNYNFSLAAYKPSVPRKTTFYIMKYLSLVIVALLGAAHVTAAPLGGAPNPSTFNTGNGDGSCVGFDVCEGSHNGGGLANCDGEGNCNGADNGNGFLNSNGFGNSNGYGNSNGAVNSNGDFNSNGMYNSNGFGNSNGI